MSGQVRMNSPLERKKWIRDGIKPAAAKSFWGPYTANSSTAIVYQENDISASEGHTVVFDYSGKLTGKAIKGKNTAYGKGEVKRKFSGLITVDRYRIPVDNGDKFDGVNIGDLTINEHSDSRKKLADLFIRWKDQMLFDAAQGSIGAVKTAKPSHIYDLGTTFDYNKLLVLEQAVKTGLGFVKASTTGAVTTNKADRRAPLEPFKTENGEDIFLFLVDSYMSTKIKTSNGYQNLVFNADVRGNNNRAITSIIGKIGRFIIVEAPDFFGATLGAGNFGLDDSEVEISGLRKYLTDGTIDATTPLVAWEGQDDFSYDVPGSIVSRGLILGQSALQMAFGKMPDYKFKSSTDFDITSESAIEFWTNAQKTVLQLEGGEDYKQAKILNLDYGVIAVDLTHA